MPMEALMMRHADRAPIEVRVSFETTRLSAQHLINAYRHLVPVQRRSLRSTRSDARPILPRVKVQGGEHG
ncbi:MAG TPA: hypothetical protein VFE90_21170 [Myxococcales bacterium]|jgi:hypothetical protein|nr:hypothetical protein [Myxococcales bacterium]